MLMLAICMSRVVIANLVKFLSQFTQINIYVMLVPKSNCVKMLGVGTSLCKCQQNQLKLTKSQSCRDFFVIFYDNMFVMLVPRCISVTNISVIFVPVSN
jgi:hypothetical protein